MGYVLTSGTTSWATLLEAKWQSRPIGSLHAEGPTKKPGTYLKVKKMRPTWAKILAYIVKRIEAIDIYKDLLLRLSKGTWI